MDESTTHQANKDEVFGRDAPRDAAGQPLEKGVGSKWAAMHPADKALFHAAETRDLANTLLDQAKALTATAEQFLAAHKSLITEAGNAARDKPDMTAAEVTDWRRTHPKEVVEPAALNPADPRPQWQRDRDAGSDQNQQGRLLTADEIAERDREWNRTHQQPEPRANWQPPQH